MEWERGLKLRTSFIGWLRAAESSIAFQLSEFLMHELCPSEVSIQISRWRTS